MTENLDIGDQDYPEDSEGTCSDNKGTPITPWQRLLISAHGDVGIGCLLADEVNEI